jgi:cation:H+ antiporter
MFLETAALLIGGSIALFAGADFLIRGSSALALKLGISPLVVGLTVVAFATSSPELLVSINAALSGNPGITLGNVIGSNICNIGLILGVSAIITPLMVNLRVVKREIPVMIAANILLFVFLIEGSINRIEGLIMLTGMIAYIMFSYKTTLNSKDEKAKETDHTHVNKKQAKLWLSIVLMITGLALLAGGSELFVKGSVQFAKALGVSDVVIGLTVVAFGTSIPELITSIVAAFKNQNDIAFGNIIGSCIFNILSIIGISSLIVPLQSAGIKLIDLLVMLGLSILILPLSKTGFVIKRWEGLLLFSIYLFYTVFVVIIPSLPQ